MTARVPTYIASGVDFLLQHDGKWLGALEGISGSTLLALADRGFAEWRWETRPHRRMVGRLTDEGRAVALERRRRLAAGLELAQADVDRLEAFVHADTHPDRKADRLAALEVIERLRTVTVPA